MSPFRALTRFAFRPVAGSAAGGGDCIGDRPHEVPMALHARVFRSLLVGGWVLIMPPVPLGTSLPPQSEWNVLSKHKTAEECEQKREAMREAARRTVSADPNASALKVAAALGQLQAQCVEVKDPEPAAE